MVEATPDSEPNTLAARRDDLQVKVSWETAQAGENAPTEFVLKYLEGEPQAVVSPAPSPSPQPQNPAVANETPEQLRQYVQDLTALGIFDNETIQPNEMMTRRQYARWLVAANNRFYANSPVRQIRLAATTSRTDVSGCPAQRSRFCHYSRLLAEAGLIPSALTGEATAVTFRPDAPLTREQLVLWKVPLDTRQALPTATVEAVEERWGFQDASRINARALRAILADFANGEQSNIRRAFGYTTLFQPQKTVTQAEAAAALWHFGIQGEGLSAADIQSLDRPSVTQAN
uniref:Uncharacterized protein n=1 Tax=Desertifilum tharense IPPAS B-1220 TaxID=1781255 RepID=A0ACD5GW39_9CYAN